MDASVTSRRVGHVHPRDADTLCLEVVTINTAVAKMNECLFISVRHLPRSAMPVLSLPIPRNVADKHCRHCDRDIPANDIHWHFQRNICRKCAAQRPTLVLPGNRTVACGLCRARFPPRVFDIGDGHSSDRCSGCRRRECCTRCHKIKKRKHFQRPSAREDAPCFKTCAECRKKVIQRTLHRRAEAVAAGMGWCTCCKRQVTEDDCRTAEGVVRATCNACRARLHNRASNHRDGVEPDHGEDMPDAPDIPDGVEAVARDEFDELYDDTINFMNIDVPEENVLNASEEERFRPFTQKLSDLKLEECETCRERDCDSQLQNGSCKRCRRDNKHDVRRFSAENNTNPGQFINPMWRATS